MECVTLYAIGHGFLQLLRILLSWPTVFLACVLLLSWRFKSGVEAILAAIAKMVSEGRNKLKLGPMTLDMNATQRGDLPRTAEAAEAIAPGTVQSDPLTSVPNEQADLDALRKEVEGWREMAADNAINYLELLLVPKTKALLYFLAAHPVQEFHNYFRLIDLIANSPAESDAIRRVIRDNEFVAFDNGKVRATGTLTNWIYLRKSKNLPEPDELVSFVPQDKLSELTAGEYVFQSGADEAS